MTNFTEFALIEINVPISLVRYSKTIYKKVPLHRSTFAFRRVSLDRRTSASTVSETRNRSCREQP